MGECIPIDLPRLLREPLKSFVTRRLREVGKTRVQFSREAGLNLSYMSQAESGRVKFNDDLASAYIEGLRLEAASKAEFLELVRFANSERRSTNSNPLAKRIAALVEMYGDDLSETQLFAIEDAMRQGLAGKFRFSPYRRSGSGPYEGLGPADFFRVIRETDNIRRRFSIPAFCRIDDLIEAVEASEPSLTIVWHSRMPKRYGDVYGCLDRSFENPVIHFCEEIYYRAADGCWVSRHILAHELGHYILGHKGVSYLQPSMVKGMRATLARGASKEEQEADFAASLLLVPWRDLVGRRDSTDAAKRYRDEPKFTEKLRQYLNIPVIRAGLNEI